MNAHYLIAQRAASVAYPTAVIRLRRSTLIACHGVDYPPTAPYDLLLTDLNPSSTAQKTRGWHARLVATEAGLLLCGRIQRPLRFASPPAQVRVEGAPVPVTAGVSFLIDGMRYTVADDCGREVTQYATGALKLQIDRFDNVLDDESRVVSAKKVIGGWQPPQGATPGVDWTQVPAFAPSRADVVASQPRFFLAVAGGNPGSPYGLVHALTERPASLDLNEFCSRVVGLAQTFPAESIPPIAFDWGTDPIMRIGDQSVGVDEPLHLERRSIMLRRLPVPWVPHAQLDHA